MFKKFIDQAFGRSSDQNTVTVEDKDTATAALANGPRVGKRKAHRISNAARFTLPSGVKCSPHDLRLLQIMGCDMSKMGIKKG
jgi:hypothetical protein